MLAYTQYHYVPFSKLHIQIVLCGVWDKTKE
jgi:hypothetical protein